MSFQPPSVDGQVSGPPQAPRSQSVAPTPHAVSPGPASRQRARVANGQNGPVLQGSINNARASARLVAALARSRAWARPAGVGARVAAFSIDAVFVFSVAAVAWLVSSSLLLGVLVLLELAVILAILESRTGITLGNLLLRLRTVRDDAPFSPGVARGATRSLVQGVASLVALVGGWVVVATSAGDPMRMGRSWADRAGRTMVVRVPTPAERAEWARGAEAWVSNSQVAVGGQAAPVMQLEQPVPRQQPRVRVPSAPQPPVSPIQQGSPLQSPVPPQPQVPQPPALQQPGQSARPGQPVQPGYLAHPAQGGAAPAAPHLLRPDVPSRGPSTGTAPPRAAQSSQFPAGVVPVDAPIATPPPVRHVEVGEQLLLTFDTGQRAQLPIPVAVNLGRRPERSEAEDQLLVVQDPEGSVSKTHLRLDYRGESVWLTDLGSTNGSEVFDDTGEGTRLTPGARVRLEAGSRVRIGSRGFTVATVRGNG